MNYYQELLESYSKIKKRSFRLVEQEKAKAKKPEAKKPGEDRPDAKPTAKDYAGEQVGTHGYKHPRAVKADGAPQLLSVDKGLKGNITLQYGGSQHVVKGVDAATGDAGIEQTHDTWNEDAVADYAAWFGQPGPEEKGEGEEGQQALTPEQQEEVARQQTQQAIEDTLSTHGLAINEDGKLINMDEEDDTLLSPELDFWGDEDAVGRDAFKEDLEEFLAALQEDLEGDPVQKGAAVEKIFDFLKVAKLSKTTGEGTITDGLSNSIRSLYKDIAFSTGGQIILNKGADYRDQYSFFLRDEEGKFEKNRNLYTAIEHARERYNTELAKNNHKLQIGDLPTQEEEHSGSPIAKASKGRNTKLNRADADEALWGGAGLVDRVIKDFSESEKGSLSTGAEKDRKWRIELLKAQAQKAVGGQLVGEMAQTFYDGDPAQTGILPSSPGQDFAVGYRDALKKGMLTYWGDEIKEDNVDSFLDTLGTDGVKAFAVMLLIRREQVKSVFGEAVPEYTVTKGGSWGNQYRLKVDTAFIYPGDAKTEAALKIAIAKRLKESGEPAGDADKYLIKKKVSELIEDKFLDKDSISPSQRAALARGEDPELIVAAVSAKAIKDAKAPIPRGGMGGNNFAVTTQLKRVTRTSDGTEVSAWEFFNSYGKKGHNEEDYSELSPELKLRLDQLKEIEQYGGKILDENNFNALMNFYEAAEGGPPDGKEGAAVRGERINRKIWATAGKVSNGNPRLRKLIGLDLFMQGGTASTHQLNTSVFVNGDPTHVESDHAVKVAIIQGLAPGGDMDIYFGGVRDLKNGSANTWSEDLTQMQIYKKNKNTGKPCIEARINMVQGEKKGGKLTQVWRTGHKNANSCKGGKATRDDSSTSLIHQFLTGQAQLLQELLKM